MCEHDYVDLPGGQRALCWICDHEIVVAAPAPIPSLHAPDPRPPSDPEPSWLVLIGFVLIAVVGSLL